MKKTIKSKKFNSLDGREFEVSFCDIDSGKSGPTLALIAGQHGMEHIGPVVLKEFADEVAGEDFIGRIFVCPCANPLALEIDHEFYPEKGDLSKINDYYYSIFRHGYCPFGMERSKGINWHNMNRLWNRKDIHGVAGKITQWLWNEMVNQADVTIDFHCLQAEKPLIYNWSEKTKKIARYFGIEAIFKSHAPDDFAQGNLGYQSSAKEGKYGFCVEFSKQHGYKNEFDIGKRGIRNVMKGIEMMDGEVILERPVYNVKEHHPLKTDCVGHIHYKFNEYDPVKKGDLLFEISSLENFEILDRAYSPVDGIFGRRTFRPLPKKDEAVVNVIEVDVLAEAGKPLEKTIL